jgi:hypothetical protein
MGHCLPVPGAAAGDIHTRGEQAALLAAAWLEAAQTSMNHAAIKDEEAAL